MFAVFYILSYTKARHRYPLRPCKYGKGTILAKKKVRKKSGKFYLLTCTVYSKILGYNSKEIAALKREDII